MGRRTRGWRNIWRGSDPALGRTFDSISEWTSKLGVGFYVELNAAQSISAMVFGVGQTVKWDEQGVVYDPYNFFQWNTGTGSAPNRQLESAIVPEGLDGMYLIVARTRWQLNTTGTTRGCVIRSTVTGDQWGAQFLLPPTGTGLGVVNENTAVGIAPWRAGQDFSVMVFHNATSSINLLSTNNTTGLRVVRVGDYREWDGF